MNWPLLVGSLVAVLLLAQTARWLGLGGDARLDEDEARALAEAQNFAIADLILDRAGLAALARDATDRFMLVRRHGAHFVAHRLVAPLDARLDHRFLAIGPVTLDPGDQASVWAARLRRLST